MGTEVRRHLAHTSPCRIAHSRVIILWEGVIQCTAPSVNKIPQRKGEPWQEFCQGRPREHPPLLQSTSPKYRAQHGEPSIQGEKTGLSQGRGSLERLHSRDSVS
jgi:hypothetical protein